MVHIITGEYQDERIKRIAYSGFQAFTIINQLSREGVQNIAMKEQEKECENYDNSKRNNYSTNGDY